MKKIKRDLQNSAFSGFLIEILKLYAQAMENVPKEERNAHLEANFSTLALLSAELTEAINRAHAPSDLEQRDNERDSAVRRLYAVLNGNEALPEGFEKQVAAAKLLLSIFEPYGTKMLDVKYSSQTGLMNSFLKDLERDDAKEACAAILGANELVALVRKTEEDFENASAKISQDASAVASLRNATAIRNEAVTLVNGSVVTLLSALSISESEKYGHLAVEFEKSVKRWNSSMPAKAEGSSTKS